jgi:hypothetical protein
MQDEATGRSVLPKDRLVHGHYYKGRCRNATIARWSAEEQCFYHWRQKFDAVFVEKIPHPADEPLFDVFRVVEELPPPKFEIPFDQEAVFKGNLADLTEFDDEMWTTTSGILL